MDFRSAGINALEFIRYYNSQSQAAGSLGMGWQSNWERRLNILSASQAFVIRPDGQQLTFINGGSGWVNLDGDVTLKLAASGSNYTVTEISGTVETYDSTGTLQTIAKANGYTQTLNYTSSLLTSVSDNQGRSLTFTYNADNTLDTMTDPDGNVYTYGYGLVYPSSALITSTQLTSVTYPSTGTPHPVLTYLYENTDYPTYLTGITDELGNRFATWAYDPSTAQATSSTLAGGADNTTITYNSDGTKTVTYPLGMQIKYTFATVANVPKVTREDRLASGTIPAANRQFTYDSNGFLASQTDWNANETTYVNNSRGLQTSRTEAYGTALARTITTTWSSAFDVPTQIVAPRKTTSFTYDSGGNMLTRTETDTTSQTVPYSTNGQTHIWTYTYDSLGHVLTVTGPRTDVTATTTYTYDSSGNRSTITDALGHLTTINTYNNRGLPTQITDANSVVTNLTYDDMGRILTSTVVATGGNATTTFVYDDAGQLTSIILPDSSELDYAYDNAHRLTTVTNNAGESINYTLDADGNVTQQDVKTSGSSIVKTQSRVFDNVSRLIQEIGASSQTTTYGYDSQGNRISAEDDLSNTTDFAFDALNRLITVTDPLSHATSYGYDAQDNKTSVTDPRTLVTSYVYNGFGQVIQETSPDRGTTVYTLDKAGNRIKEVDARSVETDRTFDKLDRVLTETYPASTGENIAYSYDSTTSGNFGIGHLTGLTDPTGSTSLVYDARGNVITDTRTDLYLPFTVSYVYDLADHLSQITYPSGRIVNYTRDSLGRISGVTTKTNSGASPVTLASNITYEPFGPVSSIEFGNGLTSTYTYDQDYRLTDIVTDDTGTNIQNLTMIYDGVNDISSITDNLDSTRDQTFTYDELYRITQGVGKYGTIDYTYDANGNRLTRTTGGVTQTSTYPSTSNKASSITNSPGTRNFTYTANGNIATDSGTGLTFPYNNRNRYSAYNNSYPIYGYNAFRERGYKENPAYSIWYNYDQKHHLISKKIYGSSSPIQEYIWLDNIPLAQISAGTVYYFHNDHLHTPQKMTDGSANIVWDRIQQPFGETYSLTGTFTSNLRFPGQYFDSESGLNYNLMRDYDPTTGRYIESDPVGWAGTSNASLNLFGYAAQNPITQADVKGLAPGLPVIGPAGTWVQNPSNGQLRFYGASGMAEVDLDFSHLHTGMCPHAHDWTNGVRSEDAYPFTPLP